MPAERSCILVVEDDAMTRESIVDLLGEAGYSVTEATNGAEALEKLRQGPAPCVILLDLMMPVMSGQEFRREQLTDPALAAIPGIVVSAGDMWHREAPKGAARLAERFRGG